MKSNQTKHMVSPQPPAERRSRRALVLFTSHPGKEAFRKHLGSSLDQCQDIYLAFLRHLLRMAFQARRQIDFDIIIASEASDIPNLERAYAVFPDTARYHFIEHRDRRFAEKLEHALRSGFAHGYEQLLVIGNDCLDLTPGILVSAFQQLNDEDVVLGPARDGGFYLLGLKTYRADLFRNIAWCTATVFQQIRENIAALAYTCGFLPCLRDIDSREDLAAWLCAPPSEYSAPLHAALHKLLDRQIILIFYLIPFLAKQHLRKRLWQIPPPGARP